MSKTAAREEADARLIAEGIRSRSAGDLVTLARFRGEFLSQVCSQKKPATVAGYRSVLDRHLIPALGARRLHTIGPRDLIALVAALEAVKPQLSPRTVRFVLTVLAFALRRAGELGYASAVLDLKPLRLGDKRIVVAAARCFTPDEVSKILEASEYPWRAFYALLAFTGMRCGEALGLAWGAVDFDRGAITVNQAAYMGRVQSTKSGGSVATLVMPPALAAELDAHLQRECERRGFSPQSEELLFPSPRDPLSPYWSSGVRRSHFAPLLTRLGIPPAGLHAFRHGFATQLFALGTPATVVRDMLRHSDMKTTLRYTHVTYEDRRLAALAIAERLTVPA